MTYKPQRRFRGTTNFGPRAPSMRNLGVLSGNVFDAKTLSGTVFGDDEVTTEGIVQEKTNAGCTPLEIAASPGTTPWNSCEAKVAAFKKRDAGSLVSWFTGGAASSLTPPTKPSSGGGSVVSTILGALIAPRAPQYPAGYPPYGYQQPGMSSTTKLALLGGGAILLFAIMRRD